jgi:glycine cleavage system H protein
VSADPLPEDLRYTKEHEWARREDDLVRIGVTDFAQDQLGDVVYVDLPAPGTEVSKGQPFGEVESTKSVSDLYAPVSGTVEERNDELDDRPELVNDDPYGAGWLVVIRPAEIDDVDSLLSVEEYRTQIE